MNARKQYLEELGKEYQRTDERGRSGLLVEAQKHRAESKVFASHVKPSVGVDAGA